VYVSSRRVRPGIRRGAIIALVVLLPIAAHSIWDYVEIQRLVRAIEAIQAKGEPVRLRGVVDVDEPRGDGFGPFAGSHYLAAALLASPDNARAANDALSAVRSWLDETGSGPADWRAAVMRAQEAVGRHADALALADRAASLEFRGLPIDTEYSYRTADLSDVSQLVAARTIGLALAGNGDRAVDSALSAIQMRRALRGRSLAFLRGSHETAAILSLSAPSAEALQRLDAALEREDRPADAVNWFLQQRALYVDTFWSRYYGTDPAAPSVHLLRSRSLGETILRPWFTHRFVEMLQVWEELLEAARTPPPRNLQLGQQVEQRQMQRQLPAWLQRRFRDLAMSLVYPPLMAFREAMRVDELTIDRASRVAVAVERYRRDHQNALPAALADLVPAYLASLPADPATGGPLIYRRTADAYVIYGAGSNRNDDGGILRDRPAARTPADAGVRVLIH
jgi:hypothetical protein